MRRPLLVFAVLVPGMALPQTAWLPLSREVERPYAALIQSVGSPMHSAVRPYARRELSALGLPDSTLLPSALPVLDRWAGVRNGRKVRWGPLLDLQAGFDTDTAAGVVHRAGAGFWFDADLGQRWSVHADAMSWHERLPAYLDSVADAAQTVPGEGISYLPFGADSGAAVAHYDWSGYVSWDPGKYFNLTLGRGKNFFGDGYRSLLLSDEATSYPYLRITTTVWRVKYVNLFASMNDIRGANGVASDFRRKWASMHYLSWNAGKRINVALFEAIVWSQGDSLYPRGFDMNYLNPIIFYRPVEYNLGSPDNALLGGSFSIKAGKRTLLYGQVVLDEFLLKEVRAGNGWFGNKQAAQLGLVARDAFGRKGLMLRAEWNAVRPFMYTHSDTRQNYAHFGQPLAHPFGSNFQEVLAQAELTQDRWLFSARASMAWLGRDAEYSYGNNIFRPESDRQSNSIGQFRNYGFAIGSVNEYTVLHAEARAGWLIDGSTGTRLEASALYRTAGLADGGSRQAVVVRVGVACYFRDRHAEQEPRYVLN
ncbi:MAG: hypothetical protein H6591_04860 [Flavobacteriales bacterium]|nr:hypothetical protein [Flavobacteriales bacterium]